MFLWWQGKEVATDVRLLPQGTVIFEDISIEQFEGTVVKVIPKVPTKNQARWGDAELFIIKYWKILV